MRIFCFGAGGMWVFGYGSLMWRPGFDFVERRLGLVRGYHRSLCIYSHVHRGTPQLPGLVLGLDRGGSCRGVAFRVEDEAAAAVLAYLRERELVTHVYRERELGVRLDDGRSLRATAYVVDTRHPQYAGRLDRPQLLALVQQGLGHSGWNSDYVRSTHRHLEELGLLDPTLKWLSDQLEMS
ncbi:MAG TPA: gamma-glutamylcyclotransferase [Beijerinckiaceae bacterium]|nr:gamma-glutamylcyclotransferase [Beijerinckiaceae bacterium]HVB89085.1 gamma-glutamylcyclotransferase [Beijerinckiaceae bacterium]